MSIFTEPMLSACIVLYHSGIHVLHTVQCFQESDIELELHVVDNSPGGTLIDHMRWQCPGILYYPQGKNAGVAGGNNLVIPHLRSQYHLICHPDVTFDDKLLGNMVNYMEHNKDCVILTPKVITPDGKELSLPKRAPTMKRLLGSAWKKWPGPFKAWHEEYSLEGAAVCGPTSVEVAHGSFLLIRTGILRQLQGFDPKFFLTHGDSDLSRRALEHGAIVYHPDMVVTHHKAEKSRNWPEMYKRLQGVLRYLRKW